MTSMVTRGPGHVSEMPKVGAYAVAERDQVPP